MPAENVTITANFRYHVAGGYVDESQHWEECFLCSTLMSAKTNHADSDGNSLCDICEYDLHTHSYSAATCTTPATCSCGATTGSVSSSNHAGGTEVRNAVAAGEFTEGYTGDTYCLGCGNVISYGETIPATHTHVLEWTYDSGMHWQKCGCGESSTAAQAHQFDDDADTRTLSSTYPSYWNFCNQVAKPVYQPFMGQQCPACILTSHSTGSCQ